MFLRKRTNESIESSLEQIELLKEALQNADAVVVGAGAGLSTSAGFTYTGERFTKYFGDFADKYHFRDMYSGGFYPYNTLREYWAYWSRYIYINRYMNPPKPVYEKLFALVEDKEYFVLTTNVDHCFQKAGFAKERIFYTQGDYGLWQCMVPCHDETYDNEEMIRSMVVAQGFVIDAKGVLCVPEGKEIQMTIPSELIPYCPVCGEPMTMNLRADDTFVEDEGWRAAQERYHEFLSQHKSGKVLYLELGVGGNTPVIIKYPFWKYTAANPEAAYACINLGQAFAPREIHERAICIDGDIGETLASL